MFRSGQLPLIIMGFFHFRSFQILCVVLKDFEVNEEDHNLSFYSEVAGKSLTDI
jgi:hypothetical protein